MKPFFDPRLRAAMGEIKTVMEKYNIGGQIDLASKTHVEFRFFAPTWAPHTKDEKTGNIVWHYRKNNPEGNNLITNFMRSMFEQTCRTFLLLEKQWSFIKEKFNPEYDDGPLVRAPERLPVKCPKCGEDYTV